MSRAVLFLLLCSCAAPASRTAPGSLARAAMDGNLPLVSSLLDRFADPNDRLGEVEPSPNLMGYQKWTALMAASRNGRFEVVQRLLKAGADVKLDDGHGATALDLALDNPEQGEEIALLLIETGAPVNTKVGVYIDDYGDGGSTALHRASALGLERVVRAMLQRGAYVHERTTARWTPLFYARTPGIVRMLLRAGAGIEARDRSQMTPLAFAIARDLDEIAIALLKEGANPNVVWEKHRTPIHEALAANRLPLIRALLEAGANPNQKDDHDRTPLQYAAGGFSAEKEEIALLLVQKGAFPAVGKDRWDIPLHGAAIAGHHRLAAALLDRGAAINLKDEDGDTALHVACEGGREEVVKLLVARGADLRIANKEGKTPVDAALKQRIRDLLLGN